MKIVTEKREVIGTLKTSLGTYPMVSFEVSGTNMDIKHCVQFQVIDDEGFVNWVWISGDFIVIPSMLPEHKEVKIVLSNEEARYLDKSELFSDEPAVAK